MPTVLLLISSGFFVKIRCPWQYILKSFSSSVSLSLFVCLFLFLRNSEWKYIRYWMVSGLWNVPSFQILSVTRFHSQAVVSETDWWGSSLRPDLRFLVRFHQTMSQDHHQRLSFCLWPPGCYVQNTILVWSYINPTGSLLQGKWLLLAYLPFPELLWIS